MKKYICVYDFECDGNKPETCEPVQLASVMIHPHSLEIVDGSEFCSWMRPVDINEPDYLDNTDKSQRGEPVSKVLDWHCGNYYQDFAEMKEEEKDKVRNEILNKWKKAPEQKLVFGQFCSYLAGFNARQSRKDKFGAPIRAGMNIRRFDNVLMDRLCHKYGQVGKEGQKIFYPRDTVDIGDLAFLWFRDLPEPKSYNMDELRLFFGISGDLAHDALKDVRDEARIIQKFLRLHRELAPSITFKDSMKDG